MIVINPKGIDYKAMKQLDISIDDLFEGIRGQGYFSIEQVQYAIMETTGKISVMPKSGFAPATNNDLKNKAEDSFLPINIICEGQMMKDNLVIANVDEAFVKTFLRKKEGKNVRIKDVLIMTIDNQKNIFLQLKGKECKTFGGE